MLMIGLVLLNIKVCHFVFFHESANGVDAYIYYIGLADVEFEILIPRGLGNGSMPNTKSRYLQYGHGLFGSYTEIQSGYLRGFADEYGYILGGVDWIGLSAQDVPAVVTMLTFNGTDFPIVPDRCHQGMLNALYFMKLQN